MWADALRDHDETPVGDRIVVLRGLDWSDYERLLAVRGEAAVPRYAYSEGQLETKTPSKDHESLKSLIGRLVEVWCLEQGIEFSPYGSWTLTKKETERGLEPDECYVFGKPRRRAARSGDRGDLDLRRALEARYLCQTRSS